MGLRSGVLKADSNVLCTNVFQANAAPLFEVHMELYNDELRYRPSLEVGADNGFLEVVENLMNDIYQTAKLVPRLAKGKLSYKVSPSVNWT